MLMPTFSPPSYCGAMSSVWAVPWPSDLDIPVREQAHLGWFRHRE